MRAIYVSQLRPGLVLGRPLLDERGNTLLNRGVTLSDTYIQALAGKGFEFVYIRDETEFDVEPEEDLSPATRAKALATLRDAYVSIEKEVQTLRTQSMETMAEACASDSIRTLTGAKGPLAKIADLVSLIMEEVLNHSNLAGLSTLRTADGQLHDHSISVCVIGLMMARCIGLPDRAMRQLAAGCLLHDLGMVFLDGELEETRRVRQHTLLGYELLRHSSNGDVMSPHVALEHHEHQDGSGLPRGTKGSNVLERDRNIPPPIPSLIGEIAAVANTYDNLLSGRRTGAPLPPDETLSTIRAMAGDVLNRAVVLAFLRCVPVYPVGAEIIVRSDKLKNFTGVVKEVNPAQLDRPIVVLTRDNQRKVIKPVTIDLKEDTEIEVNCRAMQ